MSRVYGPDNSNYKDFVPTYEYPILRRQIVKVQEDSTRTVNSPADAELHRPLRFTFQNPNPLTMIRSARYRLPMKVTFKDQEGFKITRDEAHELAFRNRQSKCFSQQRVDLNGMGFYHDSFVDRIEEFTHRYSDKNQQYQLENTGLPVCRPRTYDYKTNDSMAHNGDEMAYDLGSASDPVVQTEVKASGQTDNANFIERVKLFQHGWDQSTSTWTGTATFPLQCGPFQPYENRKSGRYPNKYIPFVDSLTVESTFDTGRGRTDPPTAITTVSAGGSPVTVPPKPDHYAVCQQLFEKSGPVVERARFLSNPPPSLELNAYSIAINGTYCWVTIPVDVNVPGLKSEPVPYTQPSTIKTNGAVSAAVGARLDQCREYYKVGSGIRFGGGFAEHTVLTEPTRQRRAVIGSLTEFTSPVGQTAGLLQKAELAAMCVGGTTGGIPDPLLNPLAQAPNGVGQAIYGAAWLQARGAATIELIGAAGAQDGIPAGMLEQNDYWVDDDNVAQPPVPAHMETRQERKATVRIAQMRDILTFPSVGIALAGMQATGAEVAALDADALHYPKVTYFVELYNDIPINWTVAYGGGDAGGYFDEMTLLTNFTRGYNADLNTRLTSNQILERLGFRFRVNPSGSHNGYLQVNANGTALPAYSVPIEDLFSTAVIAGGDRVYTYDFVDSYTNHNIGTVTRTVAGVEMAAAASDLVTRWYSPVQNGRVRYKMVDMFHVGVDAHGSYNALGLEWRSGGTNVFSRYPMRTVLYGDSLRHDARDVSGPATTGRYTMQVYPSARDENHDDFVPAEYEHPMRRGIGLCTIEWTAQPYLELELVDLHPSIKIRPVQHLWCPQKSFFYQSDLGPTGVVKFEDDAGVYVAEKTLVLSNIRTNEVFTRLTMAGQLSDASTTRFDYVEHMRPLIKSIEVQVGEAREATSHFSSELLFRMFKECTSSRLNYQQWLNNCIVCLTPAQLGLPNFTEGLSIVTAVSLKVTLVESPQAKRLRTAWSPYDYTGTVGAFGVQNALAATPGKPTYTFRTNFDYDNRSLVMNSRRELILKKNSREFRGDSGLKMIKQAVPTQQGLKSYAQQ